MKSIYRKMNDNFVNKMVNEVWRGRSDDNKWIKKGIQLEGGNKKTLKEIMAYDTMMYNHGITLDEMLDYNPYKFRKTMMKKDSLGTIKVSVSDKCLFAYAYKGKFLEQYYVNGVLDEQEIQKGLYKAFRYMDHSDYISKKSDKSERNSPKLVSVPELVPIFKQSHRVDVCLESKYILISIQQQDYGYAVEQFDYRYGAGVTNPNNWIDDERAIDATLKKVEKIKELTNAPKQFDVESYLMWLSPKLNLDIYGNFLTLLERISYGGVKWHQECEQRLKEAGLFDQYKGYKLVVFDEYVDPIGRGAGDIAFNEKYYIGYDYENDPDLDGLYDEEYVPWKD